MNSDLAHAGAEVSATPPAERVDPQLHRGWATINGDWDRLYREFPGIYDRFAISTFLIADQMKALADFSGTRVLVLAAGTGKDAFEFARVATHVVAIEPWIEVRSFAIAKQQRLGVRNIEFVGGVAEDLSRFPDGAFDRCVSVQGAPFPWNDDAFMQGCLRVMRPGGYMLFGGTTGSATAHERGSTQPGPVVGETRRPGSLTLRHGCERTVIPADLQFASKEEALATWGFIYGPPAIDYLLDSDPAPLHVNLVIHHRPV